MRVDSSTPGHVGDRPAAEQTTSASKGADEGSGEPRDAVVLHLGEAAARVRDHSPLSAKISARLEEVAAQIREGTYVVDFDVLADRLVDEELARAGR